MAGNPRVLELLEEMLNAGKTPEEVCRDSPELLTEVRERWREFRIFDAAVVDLIPGLRTTPHADSITTAPSATGPVHVPGFELSGEVGRGGMGVVYRARDLSLQRDVAVKLLQDNFPANSPIARRFTDEARITAQLQHPGVPAVYQVGALANGRPFLAMKLIKGRMLADLLRERTDAAADRGRFVAIFEQICQAVGYAHSLRVIHRDLKSSNVMVGKFGEVQVMDWGIAKSLASRERERPEESADDGTVIRIGPLENSDTPDGSKMPTPPTRAGSVLGTPAYMAPEQASGEVDRLDTPCDVFGLGSILCEILTGQPPYIGQREDQVFRKALRADLSDAHARLAKCGAEPELVALCRRCMAAEPDDRPRDAGEVAASVAALRAAAEERARRAELDRVRTAEEGKRRRVLLAASVAIVAVLLAGLSVSLWQMFRAIDAETTAKANEATANLERDAKAKALEAETKATQQAFASLRTMTNEVVERKFAAGQGHTLNEEDRVFLRAIQQQWEAFAAGQGDDADSRAVRAEGRFRVGMMRDKLGERRDAEQDYDTAVTIQKQLVADFPTHSTYRRDLALFHNNRGLLLRVIGRPKEAEADLDAALAIRKQLAADFPTIPEVRQDLAATHTNRGILLQTTDRREDAEAEYKAALAILNQLANDFPTRPEFRRELARCHNSRGDLLRTTRRPDEAAADYAAALAIQKQLASDFPTRPEFQRELAGTHNNRGELLRATRLLTEAETEYDAALAIRKQLAADFPTRPEFREDLAGSHNTRGILMEITDRPKEAEADYDAALVIRKQLADDFRNQPDLQNGVAATCVNLALLHLKNGDPAGAKRRLLDGRPHHLAALAANPKHPTYRQFYRNHLHVLTRVHASLLDRDEAHRTADVRRDLGWDPSGDTYDAACFLSVCIPIVAKHDKLDAIQREEAAKFYTDAAMKLLHDAVNKGFNDVAEMKKNTALDPLRKRDDFRAIIAKLEGTGKCDPGGVTDISRW